MKKIFNITNRWTGDGITFTFEMGSNARANGLAFDQAMYKVAYRLGCDREDLEIIAQEKQKEEPKHKK